MALYAISDLHLPLGVDKPMDVFGKAWENYVEKLYDNWQNTVKATDTVVLPGDFSWATYLEQSKKDFDFLNQLNGMKILLKGNHDYWWTTMKKLNDFITENQYKNIKFLQNNAFQYEDTAICGTRGWLYPINESASLEDAKIYARELQRLELSLTTAKQYHCTKTIVFTHYPPLGQYTQTTQFTQIMKQYHVSSCIYGHLHAASHKKAVEGTIDGIQYMLVSCDYRQFMPVKLCD